MPGTFDQALEVQADNGVGAETAPTMDLLWVWALLGFGLATLGGSLDFKPQASRMEEVSPQRLRQMCKPLQVPRKGREYYSVPPVWAGLEGQLGAGLGFLL